MICALAWVWALASGCDKLKSDNATAEAEASESSATDESADTASPKKKKKKKRPKHEAVLPAESSTSDPGAPIAPPPKPPDPVAPAPPPPAAPINYFVDATGIPEKLEARIGPTLRIYDLVLYPTYAFAKIQDPNQPLHVDQYDIRRGEVGSPTPVKFVGKVPTEAELQHATYALREPVWSAVPSMVEDAPRRLKVESPTVTHIRVHRPIPLDNEVRFRVYVSGPRSGGSVLYDVNGVMRKVYD